jgi:adenylate kinase family enzyme
MAAVHLVILGRQGSGKGTQAARLVEAYSPVHVSTGDMLVRRWPPVPSWVAGPVP